MFYRKDHESMANEKLGSYLVFRDDRRARVVRAT